MGIFRRGTQDRSIKANSADLNPVITPDDASDIDAAVESSPKPDQAADEADRAGTTVPCAPEMSRHGGPFDRSEVDGLEGRLDLGSLWLTGVPGMELRLEIEQESQALVGVTAVLGESAVQLQAFAAPRREGIWDEIRTEIAASITSQGGTADKTSGPLGTELQTRMPGQGPDGRTVFSPARFVGVDGPRWFLRAVLSGRAAIDQDAASALLEVVRTTVVVRGDEAMAPRELLTLKLPDQPDPAGQNSAGENSAGENSAASDVGADEPAKSAPSLADLKPFERGPEITEIH